MNQRRRSAELRACRVLVLGGWFCCVLAAAQEPPPLAQNAQTLEQALTAAIARAEKSVVAIARFRKDDGRGETDTAPHPRVLNPADPTARLAPAPNEYATGVVIDRQGYILTNCHVLGDPTKNDYKVWLHRRPFAAKVVAGVEQVKATDPWTDLAVLKIDAKDLEPMPFGNAQELKKGQIVIALGNPYGIARDGAVSASWGIISNLSRRSPPKAAAAEPDIQRETLYEYGGLIQTDAKLHQGTSGGALVNLKGEMIGLTTALAATDGYERGLGFAIPVDDAFRRTVETLKAGRKAEFGFLGVSPWDLSEALLRQGRQGARVTSVVPGTPAAAAEVKPDDVITRLNGVPIYDRDTLLLVLGRQPVGAQVRLTVERGGTVARRGSEVQLTAQLSKKHIPSLRPAFAQEPDPQWRGLRIDYATALPQALLRQAFQEDLPNGCLAAVAVDRDSPAWKAGLRPGTLVTHVEKRRVTKPDDFFAAVKDRPGAVKIGLALGPPDSVTVPP